MNLKFQKPKTQQSLLAYVPLIHSRIHLDSFSYELRLFFSLNLTLYLWLPYLDFLNFHPSEALMVSHQQDFKIWKSVSLASNYHLRINSDLKFKSPITSRGSQIQKWVKQFTIIDSCTSLVPHSHFKGYSSSLYQSMYDSNSLFISYY